MRLAWMLLIVTCAGCASAKPALSITYKPLQNEVAITIEIKEKP